MVRVIPDIGDMNHFASERSAACDGHLVRLELKTLQELADVLWETVTCRLLIRRTLLALDPRHVCLAQACRRFHQRVEYGLQVERRSADHLKHISRGGLLLQRVGQLASARLHLVEEPYVLDRDDRLVGEGRGERNLLVSEGS